jgi:hypothetical protein
MSSKLLTAVAVSALTAAACSPWSSSGNYLGPDSGDPASSASPASGAIEADAAPPAAAADAGAGDDGAAAENANATYAISGQVAGLEGTNLMLSLGKDRIYVQENGPFAFSTRLHEGEVYEVAIEEQPDHPTQLCTLDEGIGVVPGADITAIRVWCR